MSIILVGSLAINRHIPDFRSNPVDVDMIVSLQDLGNVLSFIPHEKVISFEPSRKNPNKFHAVVIQDGNKKHVEIEITEHRESGKLIHDYVTKHTVPDIHGVYIASPDVLYMMKLSHRYVKNSPHFIKTMDDILKFREHGISLNEDLKAILKVREKETYVQKKYALNTDKDNFFVDNVPYIYDHDTIHVAVARGEYPAYKDFQKPGEEVMCSKEMFEALPFNRKMDAVIEESSVLALERSIIPFKTNPLSAYTRALRAVCTGTTGGWFREFAWDHYYEALDAFDDGFVNKFNLALNNGDILPYKSH